MARRTHADLPSAESRQLGLCPGRDHTRSAQPRRGLISHAKLPSLVAASGDTAARRGSHFTLLGPCSRLPKGCHADRLKQRPEIRESPALSRYSSSPERRRDAPISGRCLTLASRHRARFVILGRRVERIRGDHPPHHRCHAEARRQEGRRRAGRVELAGMFVPTIPLRLP